MPLILATDENPGASDWVDSTTVAQEPPGPWTAVTLLNGYTALGTLTPGYRIKDGGTTVELRGGITPPANTLGAVAFALPAEARPAADVAGAAGAFDSGGGVPGVISVTVFSATGNVRPDSGAITTSNAVFLDGITFSILT